MISLYIVSQQTTRESAGNPSLLFDRWKFEISTMMLVGRCHGGGVTLTLFCLYQKSMSTESEDFVIYIYNKLFI